MTAKPTEHSMSQALYRHFIPAWAPLVHITADRTLPGDDGPRTIDVLLVRRSRKKGIGPIELLAVEIKVTRGDFLADVKNPRKQEAWRAIAHRHAYAAPVGLVEPEEIPAGSGLIEVGAGWRGSTAPQVGWRRKAPYTDTGEIPAAVVLTFAYRMARAEATTRGLGFGADPRDEETLRGELARLRAEADRLYNRIERLTGERDLWRTMFGAADGCVPCGTCGRPVVPSSIKGGWANHWRHASRTDAAPCAQLREAAADTDARARWEEMDPSWRHRHEEYAEDPDRPWLTIRHVRDIQPAELDPAIGEAV